MSSYGSPAAVGSAQGTGAYAVGIAAQAGTTNNDGHAVDSAGNMVVDFVWGQTLPIQPNDQRTETAASNIGGSTGDAYWAATTQVTGARLDFAGTSAYSGSNAIPNVIVKSGRHEIVETGWGGYPSFTPATGKFNITQAAGDGTTIRYECQNFLAAGDSVNITGVNGLNLSAATVASATRDYFTVTNSTVGNVLNINNGSVERTDALTAADGSYVSAVAYINVPAVVGLTTALALDALKDAGYAAANITTASAAANATISATAAARTSGSTTATVTAIGAGAAFPVGTKVVIAGLATTAAELNGTWTVTASATNTVSFVSSASTAIVYSGVAGTIQGLVGTIKTQSTAAGAASVALSATITVTPYAAS